MTDKQPEALSIARRLKDQQQPLSLALRHKAAAKLCYLHEVNAELVSLLIRYRKETPLGNQPHMIAHLADAAIAKATGEQQ